MEPTSTVSSWLTASNASFFENNSSNGPMFWTNGAMRKRKAAVTELDEQNNQKMFASEEKMVKDMRTLSLEFNTNQSNDVTSPTTLDDDFVLDEVKSNVFIDEETIPNDEKIVMLDENVDSPLKIHPIVQEKLKNNDFQDSLIKKLCDIERKKLSMQLVPYMPIHPSQLENESPKKNDEREDSPPSVADDHLFKRPELPTPYTVEEPCEGVAKRASTMKRSFSQCNQYNSHLFVTELSNDTKDDLALNHSSSYFIVEPPTPSLDILSESNSSISSNGPSVRITECTNSTKSSDVPNSLDGDDDIDMQSVASSDTADKMDDD